jgi:molybdenum cofactor synthesis domain-containing protein
LKTAILTIGTEVVDGEIVNTNASWLATELSGLGFTVTHHLSTADELKEMQEAMAWLEAKVDWLFVTGGLGPTSDDKTREAVANFLGQPLVYDKSVFAKLSELHKSRGIRITEAHKHQCFFPKTSRPLPNPVGSALGFRDTSAKGIEVVVLPGPPRELHGVFQQEVQAELEAFKLKRATLKSWILLGITESGAAEIAERIFSGSDILLGYRASLPYVHIKAWFPDENKIEKFSDKLEAEFRGLIVARDGQEPLRDLLEVLRLKKDKRIVIRYDVGFVETPIIKKYGGHEDQLSRKYIAMDYYRIKSLAEFIHSDTISDEERSHVTDVMSKKCEILMRGFRRHNNMDLYPEVEQLANQLAQVPL